MQRFRIGNADTDVPGLRDHEQEKIKTLFQTIQKDDGNKRHKIWLQHISNGYFGFRPVNLSYKAKGINSWKHEALGTTKAKDSKSDKFIYEDKFLRSNWKMFHDALQAHRFYVIHNLLPHYGICAA